MSKLIKKLKNLDAKLNEPPSEREEKFNKVLIPAIAASVAIAATAVLVSERISRNTQQDAEKAAIEAELEGMVSSKGELISAGHESSVPIVALNEELGDFMADIHEQTNTENMSIFELPLDLTQHTETGTGVMILPGVSGGGRTIVLPKTSSSTEEGFSLYFDKGNVDSNYRIASTVNLGDTEVSMVAAEDAASGLEIKFDSTVTDLQEGSKFMIYEVPESFEN